MSIVGSFICHKRKRYFLLYKSVNRYSDVYSFTVVSLVLPDVAVCKVFLHPIYFDFMVFHHCIFVLRKTGQLYYSD